MKETREAGKGPNTTGAAKRPSWLRRAFAQLRIKLTLPYVFLALAVAFVAAYLVTRLLVGLLDDRFQANLLDAGKKAADRVVQIEQEQRTIWRAIAYTEGFVEAVVARDGNSVTLLAVPPALNVRLDCLAVLDSTGNPLLALHHQPGGGVTDYISTPAANYSDWEIVRRVLAGEVDEIGDKYADLVETDLGWVLYRAGPIKHEGQVVGVLLVGTYLDNMVEQMRNAALADISVYRGGGAPLATTLASEGQDELALDEHTCQAVLAGQEQGVPRQEIKVAGRGYAEVLGAFEVRHGYDLGVLAVALPLSFVTDLRSPTRGYLLSLFISFTVLVLLVGALLASGVVQRVRRLATATQRVAQGDLTTQVESRGYDEVASLGEDFNRMVVQLREGRTYRDLLGLTASPEVAEELRRGIEGGRVMLDSQLATASVFFCDIRDFTRLSENRPPDDVIRFLNEYMEGVVKVVRNHNGIINKFVGDAALAFFGLLPDPRPPGESACAAISTALAMLDYLDGLNRQRCERNEEPLRVGIGVNTGPVVAGMVGSEVRLEYTVLGDAVNVAQRLSDLNKEYPQYSVFFSAETCRELGGDLQSRIVHIGEITVKGRAAPVDVYALKME